MAINIKEEIRKILKQSVGDDVPFIVEAKADPRADYSSNIALVRAKRDAEMKPLLRAEIIARSIKEEYPEMFESIEAAEPGFLNFKLTSIYIREVLHSHLEKKKKSSRSKSVDIKRASVEFISANPTGPLHIGNARGGPIGDTIANVLEESGFLVTREYFHNDAGAQVGIFAESLWHWYLKAMGKESQLPEVGYEGEYIKEVSEDAYKKWKGALERDPDGKKKLVDMALRRFYTSNFAVVKKMGIKFDKITKESSLAKSKTKKVLEDLEERGFLQKKDGAVWFSHKDEQGNDKDSVVIKSDGSYVYFANDIAYHEEKFERADLVINEFGEGHHGHIPKLQAVAEAFGFPVENLRFVVHGQVTIVKDGKAVSMAKRKGNFITAKEVLNAVGADVFRYFMLQYAPKSGMQFDMALAKERSKKNPVFYIQYAHARTCSILAKAKKKKIDLSKAKWENLETEAEEGLLKNILVLPEVIDDTAKDYQVQRLAKYSMDLAKAFTKFYETTRVIGEGKKLEAPRLALVMLTRDTLEHVLKLLGISAPKKM